MLRQNLSQPVREKENQIIGLNFDDKVHKGPKL